MDNMNGYVNKIKFLHSIDLVKQYSDEFEKFIKANKKKDTITYTKMNLCKAEIIDRLEENAKAFRLKMLH